MNREVHVQFWEGVGLRCPALLAYLKAYQDVGEARCSIAAYFKFYNHERLHQALGYRTPRQVFEEALQVAKLRRGRKTACAVPKAAAQSRIELGGPIDGHTTWRRSHRAGRVRIHGL